VTELVCSAKDGRVILVIASLLALLIGLSLGAVGGGGSILAVPVLVSVLGLSVEEATASSLVVVGVASLVGVLSHARAGRVAVSVGLGFAAVGVAGSYLGTRLNERIDGDVLLLGFAVLMGVVGTRMLQGLRRADSLPVDDVPLGRLRPDPVAGERSAALPRCSDGARLHRYVSTVTEADPVQTARGLSGHPFGWRCPPPRELWSVYSLACSASEAGSSSSRR